MHKIPAYGDYSMIRVIRLMQLICLRSGRYIVVKSLDILCVCYG